MDIFDRQDEVVLSYREKMKKFSHVNTSGYVSPTMSTEHDKKRTPISFVDWLNELDAQTLNTVNKNPFKQDYKHTACTQPVAVTMPTHSYNPSGSQQTVRESNPFKSVMENEVIQDSGFDTLCYASTPANSNF